MLPDTSANKTLYALQVNVQLKRLERLLTEKDSSVAFAQHVKPISKKAAKKAKRDDTRTSGTGVVKKKKKEKKAKVKKGKSAEGGVTKPKKQKNKDKYNKKKLAGSKAGK